MNTKFNSFHTLINAGGVFHLPMIEFSKKDILRGKVVDPAWYRLRITSTDEAQSKDQKSTNYPIEAEILYNADNGDTTFAGVPVMWMFNSKAMGFMVGFIKALTGEEPTEGSRFRLEDAVGMELDVFVENKEYEGNIRNQVNHKYRMAQSVQS